MVSEWKNRQMLTTNSDYATNKQISIPITNPDLQFTNPNGFQTAELPTLIE